MLRFVCQITIQAVLRTNFCSYFVNKRPGNFEIQKSEITLLRCLCYPVILTKRF
nr:MAG TPA: protein of unknown function (DUF5352) [Caudoviricetes sp.]